MAISMATLGVTVLGSVLFRGFLAIIPILIGVLAGYALSAVLGIVDFAQVTAAPWFALPTFYHPRFEWMAILTILPAALVVIAEHVGHLVVTANIVQRDLLRDPGLHRSMFANGASTLLFGFFGSTPNTTYGENIGGAAILAIALSCVGKLATAIQAVPVPMIGGVSLLLYGVIASSGIRVLIESKVNYDSDLGDFDYRRQRRENSPRRRRTEGHGAGDHSGYRAEPDIPCNHVAARRRENSGNR